MTRLLVFLAVYFAGALGTNYGGYGGGETAGGSGSKDYGQQADGSSGAQGLNANTGEGKDAAVKPSINVLEKSQGGGKPIQYIGQPSQPLGKTHQVRSVKSSELMLPQRAKTLPGHSRRLSGAGLHPR